jgi:phenylacetic acid degradation operon negative regulatory protein
MQQSRNTPGGAAVSAVLAEERPYTARSVMASTLLGIDPPRLPTRLLVRTGELFGIAEGTTRVAVSRMVAAGELLTEQGHYRLSGRLLERQARQHVSRAARTEAWDGTWRTEVVVTDAARSAAERADLRAAMGELRLAEWREGVWLRPTNLGPWPATSGSADGPEAVVRAQCRALVARPIDAPGGLAAELWDLDGWAGRARLLHDAIGELLDALETGDNDALPPGFVVSAAVLRHFVADPLLPAELVPNDWPGAALRRDYDRYDRAFKATWAASFAAGA